LAQAGEKRSEWISWAGWAVLFLATSAIILHDSSRSIFPIYQYAALAWFKGQQIYEMSGIGGFTYFPQAAILFSPFAILPRAAGEMAWRLVSIGAIALALRSFGSLVAERSGKNLFPLMTLVAIPIVWDCARNGQATLLMTAVMLMAVVDVARLHWWRATLWLALAVAIKPLAIVLVLLIAAINRPMTSRALFGMVLLALFPFLTQRPGYVIEQYVTCLQNMAISAHVGVAAHGWTSPFTALRAVTGIDVPEKLQTLMRLAGALGTLVLCYVSRRRHDAATSAIFLFSLAALYVMLFSPRTENNTYAMLGPALALFLARAVKIEGRSGEAILLGVMALALVASRPIERLLAPHAEQIWLSPLVAACLAVYVIVKLFSDKNKVVHS
jgi:hypothetical protein